MSNPFFDDDDILKRMEKTYERMEKAKRKFDSMKTSQRKLESLFDNTNDGYGLGRRYRKFVIPDKPVKEESESFLELTKRHEQDRIKLKLKIYRMIIMFILTLCLVMIGSTIFGIYKSIQNDNKNTIPPLEQPINENPINNKYDLKELEL